MSWTTTFAPQLTVGLPFVRAITTSALKDVHLMVEEPLDQLESFVAAGADVITVHVESGRHIRRVLRELGAARNTNDSDRGTIRGIALNPGTAVYAIEPLLADVDLVLLLAVDPGWSGQTLDAAIPQRLRAVRELIPAGRHVLVGSTAASRRRTSTKLLRSDLMSS